MLILNAKTLTMDGGNMTIPTLPPYVPPFQPVPQITPFTYRDGVTYLEKLEGIVAYVNKVIVPFVNDNFDELADDFQEQVNLLIIAVNAAIESVINSSIEVQDPIVAALVGDTDSATSNALDLRYALKSAVDSIQAIIDTGRLSETGLNAVYATLTYVAGIENAVSAIESIIDTGRLSQTALDVRYADKTNVYTKAEVYAKTESDYNFVSDYSSQLKNKKLFTQGDSQGTTDGGNTIAFGTIFNQRNGGTLVNENVSSSFWRDTAQRLVGTAPYKTSDDIVLIACGINGPARYPSELATRQAEYQACKAAILMNGVALRIEHTSAVFAGTWADYTLTNKLSNSTGKSADTGAGSAIGATATWTLGGYGNYFAIGYSFRAGTGAVGRTGDWAVGATNKLADNALAPSATALELTSSPQSSGNLVPQVVDLPGMNSQSVVATYRGSGIMIADAVFKLMDKPPMIGIILPTYCKPGGSLAVSNDAVDRYRGDIRNAIADVCSKYPNFRGRVFAVDPNEYGFNVDTNLMPDGLHWNDSGQALVEKAFEHTYSRTLAMRNVMESFGIAGFNWGMF